MHVLAALVDCTGHGHGLMNWLLSEATLCELRERPAATTAQSRDAIPFIRNSRELAALAFEFCFCTKHGGQAATRSHASVGLLYKYLRLLTL